MNEDENMLLDDEDLKEDTPINLKDSEEGAEAEQTANQPTTPPAEDEDSKVLSYINSKGIKFNGENVSVNSIDDLINTYQKGLNYDKVANRDDVVMSYIKDKASKLNISPEEYINRVKRYEEEKNKEAQEQDVQNLINEGVSEKVAREVIQTKLAREMFEKKNAELQQRLDEEERKAKENKEYEEFIIAHPDVKAEDIPKEVFESAKTIGLNNAYNQYENKILKEKIKQMEQSAKNASNSIVTATSDGSSTEQESKDAFLMGFDSE